MVSSNDFEAARQAHKLHQEQLAAKQLLAENRASLSQGDFRVFELQAGRQAVLDARISTMDVHLVRM